MSTSIHADNRKNAIKEAADACDEFFIASALITASGFNELSKSLTGKKGRIIIGSDLDSDKEAISAIRDLLGDDARIYPPQEGGIFHPKIYAFVNKGKTEIFIGSGNWTYGGLSDNDELFIKTDDQDSCKCIADWFDGKFRTAAKITDAVIASFDSLVLNNAAISAKETSRKQKLHDAIELQNTKPRVNLNDFYFKEIHFDAFKGGKPFDPSADLDRSKVVQRLIELHEDVLWPEIKLRNWEIYPHNDKNHTTSTSILSQANAINIKSLDCIWLHYGKHESEIAPYKALFTGGDVGETNRGTFIHHMRLQVIVRERCLGVWLVFGKPKAQWDRDHMKKKFKNDNKFKTAFSELLSNLDREYDVEVNGLIAKLNSLSPDDIIAAESRDRIAEQYFRIGIDYQPDDPRINSKNIKDTIVGEFSKLYPIYEICKAT